MIFSEHNSLFFKYRYQASSSMEQTKQQYNYQRQQLQPPPRRVRAVLNAGNGGIIKKRNWSEASLLNYYVLDINEIWYLDSCGRGRACGRGRGRGWSKGGYASYQGSHFLEPFFVLLCGLSYIALHQVIYISDSHIIFCPGRKWRIFKLEPRWQAWCWLGIPCLACFFNSGLS